MLIKIQKALNLFNAALVTPTYYVFFTSSTIVTSAILFRGFKGSPTSIATVVMGFLQICAGVILLQLSKSAKDVPDAAVFSGDLDQVRTIAEQEQPESEPKADAIRGAAAIVRRFSVSRQKAEALEAKRVHEERLKDQLEPIGENEQVEWDGLRRRKTLKADAAGSLNRRKTLHPPLGLTHFPGDEEDVRSDTAESDGGAAFHGGFMNSLKRRAQSTLIPGQTKNLGAGTPTTEGFPRPPSALTDLAHPAYKNEITAGAEHSRHPDESMEMSRVHGLPSEAQQHSMDGSSDSKNTSPSMQQRRPIMWAHDVDEQPRSRSDLAPNPPRHSAQRQFSFQNVFHRHRNEDTSESVRSPRRPEPHKSSSSRHGSKEHNIPGIKSATEEERLGLVKGDSSTMLPLADSSYDDELPQHGSPPRRPGSSGAPPYPIYEEKELERRERWRDDRGSPESWNMVPTTARRKRFDEDSDSDRDFLEAKEWEGRGGGGVDGGPGGNRGAFI